MTARERDVALPGGAVLRRFADVPEVAEPGNGLVLRGLVDAADPAGDLSATWVRLEGHHRRLRTDASARLYVVLHGGGTIAVGDADPVVLADGDVVLLPPGTPYDLDGPLTYLVMNRPAYRDGDDVYLED